MSPVAIATQPLVMLDEHGYVFATLPGSDVISAYADVEYKCSDVYDPAAERGVMWNDPDIGIDWPVTDPILSARDRAHPPLAALRI